MNNRQEVLNRFIKHVVSQAKKNLTTKNKNASKKLYNSINGEAKAFPNSIGIYFEMEEYGFYQDQGVRGANPSKVSKNAKIRGQQAPNSRFKFGSGSSRGSWGSFVGSIEKWAKRRNIRLRDEEGKFKKGNYKTIAKIIASNIYARGLKPTFFFTKPFEAAFKNLPDDLIESYGFEVEDLFDSIMKQNFKK
jgi:hypothetical protein